MSITKFELKKIKIDTLFCSSFIWFWNVLPVREKLSPQSKWDWELAELHWPGETWWESGEGVIKFDLDSPDCGGGGKQGYCPGCIISGWFICCWVWISGKSKDWCLWWEASRSSHVRRWCWEKHTTRLRWKSMMSNLLRGGHTWWRQWISWLDGLRWGTWWVRTCVCGLYVYFNLFCTSSYVKRTSQQPPPKVYRLVSSVQVLMSQYWFHTLENPCFLFFKASTSIGN